MVRYPRLALDLPFQVPERKSKPTKQPRCHASSPFFCFVPFVPLFGSGATSDSTWGGSVHRFVLREVDTPVEAHDAQDFKKSHLFLQRWRWTSRRSPLLPLQSTAKKLEETQLEFPTPSSNEVVYLKVPLIAFSSDKTSMALRSFFCLTLLLLLSLCGHHYTLCFFLAGSKIFLVPTNFEGWASDWRIGLASKGLWLLFSPFLCFHHYTLCFFSVGLKIFEGWAGDWRIGLA